MDGGRPVSALCHTCLPCISQTYLLIDRQRQVIGVLLGQPRDLAGWQKAHRRALQLFRRAAQYFASRRVAPHRRGVFPTLAHGISFGGGQQVRARVSLSDHLTRCVQRPRHLRHSGRTARALNRLMQSRSIVRICNYASGMPASFLPEPL